MKSDLSQNKRILNNNLRNQKIDKLIIIVLIIK
jgi:hypothetical protein